MTAHGINPTTLQRCKAAISCTRLIGHNAYDVLAGKIDSIHYQFELRGKVIFTITDNRSNFVKAFKTFSVYPTPSSTSEEEIEQKEGVDHNDKEEATFENVYDTLMLHPEKDDDYTQVEYEWTLFLTHLRLLFYLAFRTRLICFRTRLICFRTIYRLQMALGV